MEWRERVTEERDLFGGRIVALKKYIESCTSPNSDGVAFTDLSAVSRDLLCVQLNIMRSYHGVLSMRLAAEKKR